MTPKVVSCSRCELPILEGEKMIVLEKGSNEVVSRGGDLGARTTDADTLRHGDTAVCMERLKKDAQAAKWKISKMVAYLKGEGDW